MVRLLLLFCSAVVASAVVGRTSPPLSSEKGKGFLQCKVCEQSLSKVQQLVASEDVQNKVVDVLVNDVCPKTPEVEKCQQYAKAGVPMAAQYITAHFAPDTTCTDLKLCSKTMAAQVAKPVGASNETCSFCKAAGPEETAEATIHAITSCRPRKYYQTAGAMGIPTWLVLLFLQGTPTDVVDWMIGKL